MSYCPSLLSLFINYLHSCSSLTIFLTFLEFLLSLSSDLRMLRGWNFIATSYLRWKRKKQFVQQIQEKCIDPYRKGKSDEKRKDGSAFSVQKGVRGVPAAATLFSQPTDTWSQNVRELENLQILLSFTVIPTEILTPGDSSSRSRLP